MKEQKPLETDHLLSYDSETERKDQKIKQISLKAKSLA